MRNGQLGDCTSTAFAQLLEQDGRVVFRAEAHSTRRCASVSNPIDGTIG
ncbi:hypothetical protein [Rhodanobacter sp. C03]|nr:hypothetical protein [Rhodanobacter sp. C03]